MLTSSVELATDPGSNADRGEQRRDKVLGAGAAGWQAGRRRSHDRPDYPGPTSRSSRPGSDRETPGQVGTVGLAKPAKGLSRLTMEATAG